MENNNKKTLILSIVGILVLVIAVVGVSFAMYSFTGTGTKENVITAGQINLSFDDANTNNFTVENKYPMSDAKGVASTDTKADFAVTGTWGTSAGITFNYDLGISSISEGATLKSNFIKVVVKNGAGEPVVGTATAGVTIASLASKAGTYGLVKTYALTSGQLTTSGQVDKYSIVAYVADDYKLPTATDTTGENATTTETGVEQKKATGSETYSFKITVAAAKATA